MLCLPPLPTLKAPLICNERYRSQGNISFNEIGLCVGTTSKENNQESINVGLLKTPVRKKGSLGEVGEIDEGTSPCRIQAEQLTTLHMTTPMALKDISNRAQRELAMLYSPCIEEEECPPSNELVGSDSVCKQLWS